MRLHCALHGVLSLPPAKRCVDTEMGLYAIHHDRPKTEIVARCGAVGTGCMISKVGTGCMISKLLNWPRGGPAFVVIVKGSALSNCPRHDPAIVKVFSVRSAFRFTNHDMHMSIKESRKLCYMLQITSRNAKPAMRREPAEGLSFIFQRSQTSGI